MAATFRWAMLALALLVAGASPAVAQAPARLDPAIATAGQAVYAANCAVCHDNALTHAPSRQALGKLSPETIVRVLTSGRMQAQGSALDQGEKHAVAQALAARPLGAPQAEVAMPRCTGAAAQFDIDQPPVFDGWGLDARNTHAIPTALAGLTAANVGRLRLKWAFAVPNAVDMRSQPALAGGAIYLGGGNGTLYALDRATGCLRWSFEASASIRSGVIVSPWQAGDRGARPLVYFGDSFGHAYALDAQTGEEVWHKRIDDHPDAVLTGAPALHGDTLYVPVSSFEEGSAAVPGYACCSFRGSILALDARTGEEKWRTWLVDPPQRAADGRSATPSGIAVWSTPLVDAERGQLYVTTGDNYTQPTTAMSDAVVALDLATGAVRWTTQVTDNDSWNVACFAGRDAPNCPADAGPDFDFGAAAVLARGSDGRERLLVGQKSGVAYALDPASGERLWQTQVGRGGELGGVHFGIAADDGKLYVPIHDASFPGGIAGAGKPGIYALDVATGSPVWAAAAADVCAGAASCQPGYSAAISVTPELVLAGAADAHLRIFDAKSGAVLWDQDTNAPFPTVNGVTGHGGSMSGGAAPLALDGTLIVNSGYAFLGKLPGNVLLVYSVE